MQKMLNAGACRHCGTPLSLKFADLGSTPISNDFLAEREVNGPDPFYPLRAFVCQSCRLVQLQDFFRSDDLFRADYAYFSSISTSWLEHAKTYADTVCTRFALDEHSHVVEIASNDGYLLQYFKARNVPVLGVEPSLSVAKVAIEERGIPTVVRFFGVESATELVAEGKSADLIAANNVLAHVPDINDFVKGFAILLKPQGVATFEFPHLLQMIRHNQFDTIYHEHFSYLSLLAVERILTTCGLRVFDIDVLPTHGGSLRLYTCRADSTHAETARVNAMRAEEKTDGLDEDGVYIAFEERVRATKRHLLTLLIDLKAKGKRIVGYGAPAKGNTLLNYCGIGADMLDFTVDRSPYKQGFYLPGSRLPIYAPSAIDEARPDYVLILPWNLKDEVMAQLSGIRAWGGQFIVPIPTASILA